MRIPRIFTPQDLAAGTRVTLDRRAAHYLLNVLRAEVQTVVTLFNGDGHDYTGRLVQAGKTAPVVRIATHATVHTESPLHLTLAQGIARGRRMDYNLQKAVELGVNRIVPLFCERTEVKLSAARLDKRCEHWRGVIIGACEQSGRARLPELLPPLPLMQWLAQNHASDEVHELKLALALRAAQNIHACTPANRVTLLIGPEGGLSDAELQRARRAGFAGVRFGPRTLRTETAGPAALAALQALWGDLG